MCVQMHARGFNITPFVLFTVNSGLMQALAHPLLSSFFFLFLLEDDRGKLLFK